MLHSIPFFPSENGNPAVPGKATKASSSTKRSIADSEDKSEAYKSIFTTHSSAKRSKEECSNWVTHTAYYFWNNEEPQGAPLAPLLPLGSLCQLWHKLLSWSWLQFLGLEVGNKAVRGWGTCVSCSFCSVRSRQHNPWWSSNFILKCWDFCTKILLFSSQLNVILSQCQEEGGRSSCSPLLICAITVITIFSVLLQNSNPL